MYIRTRFGAHSVYVTVKEAHARAEGLFLFAVAIAVTVTVAAEAAISSSFIAHEVAIQLVGSLRGSIDRLALKDSALADQLRRSASSVLLNIAEGARRAGNRAHHYRIAAGSAAEVGAALDVAAAWGHLDEAPLDEVRRLVDRELGLLWGLTRR